MKSTTLIAVLLLSTQLLIGIVSAGTFQVGSHNVSFNLSVPANYTIEVPVYVPESDTWIYQMTIRPSINGFLAILVDESSIPYYGSKPIQDIADFRLERAKSARLGGYKYGMTTYQGHDAFEDSAPEQREYQNGDFITTPEFYRITYMLDEKTTIILASYGAGETLYQEVLDSMNITKNDIKSSQLEIKGTKSFIGPTSAYAGTGKGAKLGMEDQNIVTMLGDSQSSNITVGPHGVK